VKKLKIKSKKTLYVLGMLLAAGLTIGIAYAAFTDENKVLGSTFSVGSADIKFFNNLAGNTEPTNLVDELPGPTFTNIGQTWSSDYPLKIYNNGTSPVSLTSHSFYETANDPAELRSDISVEIFEWNDANYNGLTDPSEVDNVGIAKKTLVKWKTEGIGLGQLNAGVFRSFVLRFSTTNLSETKQGQSALFDFEFESAEL
jgi:hypothetical protein